MNEERRIVLVVNHLTDGGRRDQVPVFLRRVALSLARLLSSASAENKSARPDPTD